jgi:hypothetical protein
VTVPLGAKLLKVTPKAVDLMLAQLGELSGGNLLVAPAIGLGASCDREDLRQLIPEIC